MFRFGNARRYSGEVSDELRQFHPGERIVIREVLNGQIWTVRPVTVIEDSNAQLATWLAPGTMIEYPVDVEHGEKCFSMWLSGHWTLAAKEFRAPGILRVAPHGAPYEIFAPITPVGGVEHWYVNFEQPLQRTNIGFDTMDEILDLVVATDLQSWWRKDEDEVELAVAMGFLDRPNATRIIDTCNALEELLLNDVAPWDQSWSSWRPSSLSMLP